MLVAQVNKQCLRSTPKNTKKHFYGEEFNDPERFCYRKHVLTNFVSGMYSASMMEIRSAHSRDLYNKKFCGLSW